MGGHNFTVYLHIARCSKCHYSVNLSDLARANMSLDDLYALRCAYDIENPEVPYVNELKDVSITTKSKPPKP